MTHPDSNILVVTAEAEMGAEARGIRTISAGGFGFMVRVQESQLAIQR